MRTSTLSEKDLKKFCEKTNLPFHIEDMSNILTAPKNCFIHTGSKENNINNGYTNHWCFLHGNKLFCPYNFQKNYNLPPQIESINSPTLQEFGSNVCGEYCCAFYWFISKIKNKDYSDLGPQFVDYFNLGNNKEKNDKKINQWFDEITK